MECVVYTCVGSSHKIKSCKIQSHVGVGVGVGGCGWVCWEELRYMMCMSAMERITC